MSDIEVTTPATAATNLEIVENGQPRDATTPDRKISPAEAMETEPANNSANVADDSEAETLIESPEKRRAAAMESIEPTVKTEATETTSSLHDNHVHQEPEEHQEPELPSSDPNNRKRKREDHSDRDGGRRVPSAPSSVLSSPSPDELQADLSDEMSRTDRSPTKVFHRDREDRRGGPEILGGLQKDDQQLKVQKRRPSDVITHDQKAQSVKRRQGSDNQDRRETRSATYPRHSSSERSPSPHQSARSHKRVQSIQSINTNIGLNKTRRLPPPLPGRPRNRSEDRHSLTSEGSGSPGPSVPNLRKFTATDHEAISPAKQPMPLSRRNRDQNGRTRLAKACADNKLDTARARHEERPEDINVPDNAGNTPLQIASLEGFVDIVEFLLSKNCEIDTKNIDKETPLIDAVENGHLEVVQLLLDHGANPRLGNAKGDEPYELVPHDDENYGAIRALLANARTKQKDHERRPSDDRGNTKMRSSSRAASAASPRDSPPITTPRSPPSNLFSRRRTGRSEVTRNDLLWQAQTPENLQKLAAKGDSEGVASILNVLEKVHPAAVVAAARGGHHQTLEMLIALGQPDPDPPPVRNGDFKPGYNTPMLAAIGRGNIDVIKLLLGQTGFNPRRQDAKGRTYPDISRERKGERWEEEYQLLKDAYERTRAKHDSPRKHKERERESKKLERRSLSPVRTARKVQRSPTSKETDNRSTEVHRENKQNRLSSDHKPVKNHERERSPTHSKTHRTRRSQSDLPLVAPDGEVKRRRLISGKERRASIASQKSSSDFDHAEIRANGSRELKKEKSILKRPRDSATPERPVSRESDVARDMQKKRRRVLSDSPEQMRAEPIKSKREASPSEVLSSKQQQPISENIQVEVPPEPQEIGHDQEMEQPGPQASDHSHPEIENSASHDATSEADRIKAEDDDRVAKEEAERNMLAEEEHRRVLAEKEAAEAAEAAAAAAEAAETARLKAEEEAQAAEQQRKLEEAAAEQRRLEEEAAAEQRRIEEIASARKREEEERVERLRKEEEERLERLRREEERQRRIEERRRREAEEQERRRREALPSLLCKTAEMMDLGNPLVREHSWIQQFLPLFTVHTRQLESRSGDDIPEEEWIPNFQAAGVLAAKDLHLRQYTQLEKRPVNKRERLHLWKVAGVKLSKDFKSNAFNSQFGASLDAYDEAGAKFSSMDPLFWVRLSDFRDLIPLHNHLKGLTIKTQRIRVHPIQLPSSEPPHLDGIMPPAQDIKGVLTNGISHAMNGYHHH